MLRNCGSMPQVYLSDLFSIGRKRIPPRKEVQQCKRNVTSRAQTTGDQSSRSLARANKLCYVFWPALRVVEPCTIAICLTTAAKTTPTVRYAIEVESPGSSLAGTGSPATGAARSCPKRRRKGICGNRHSRCFLSPLPCDSSVFVCSTTVHGTIIKTIFYLASRPAESPARSSKAAVSAIQSVSHPVRPHG